MPVSLTQTQINEYAGKWLNGTITEEEKKAFEQWYNEQGPGTVLWNTGESETELQEKIFDRITSQMRDEEINYSPGIKNYKPWLIAASLIVMIFSGIGIFLKKRNIAEAPVTKAGVNTVLPSEKTVTYIRSLTLPDGSIAVLHANSSLYYPEKFSGDTREVTLTGEAYFDIKHGEKPFIIHTGELKTIVLGTAFNIKAYPDSKDITVSVIRGKVRVEDKTKVLAVLIPDQQVTCNISAARPVQQTVDAATVITGWTKQDMVFEDVSFQTVAGLLSRRYGVNITFKNPALGKCTIKAFFNGTEPLDKVLGSLCLISNAVFTKMDPLNIIIDGEGCGEQ